MTDETRTATTANGLTIAGFAVSIIALLLSFFGGGLIPGIIAIVLLAIGGRRGGRTPLGVAGSVMTIVAIVLSLVISAIRVANGG